MKKFKEFFFEFGEWFADATDYIRLFWLVQKIKNLNEELDWDIGFCNETPEAIALLGLYSEAHNEILSRIRAREARHYRAVAH